MRTGETGHQDTVTATRLPQPRARSCRITSSSSLRHLVIVLRISTLPKVPLPLMELSMEKAEAISTLETSEPLLAALVKGW